MPKLREYKGVVYKDGKWWLRDIAYLSAAAMVAFRHEEFTDADHVALLELKNNPYEPLGILENIVDEWSRNSCGIWPTMRDDLCNRIREAFPNIDGIVQTETGGSEWPTYVMIRDTKLHDDLGGGGQRIFTTAGNGYEKRKYIRDDLANKTLTMKDHVDALIKMGAKYYSGEHPYMEGYPRLVLPKVK